MFMAAGNGGHWNKPNKIMKTIPIQLTIALLAGTVAAQQPQPENGHRPPPPPLILVIFDTDHDGVLSAREIRKASDALAALDRNGDRQLTRDELRPPPPPEGGDGPEPGKPPGHRPPPPVIAALDTDKDGTLSAEELKAAPETLLELDINGDGKLSPEELHPHGPPPPPPDGEPMPEE
jgi:hypothetical protein